MRISLRETIKELRPEVPKRIQRKVHIIASCRRNRERADYEDMIQEGMCAWLESRGKSRSEREKAIGSAISKLCYADQRSQKCAPLHDNIPVLEDFVEHAELCEALEQLAPWQRDVMAQFYIKGETYKAINARYGKEGQWARRAIEKSLGALRQWMIRS